MDELKWTAGQADRLQTDRTEDRHTCRGRAGGVGRSKARSIDRDRKRKAKQGKKREKRTREKKRREEKRIEEKRMVAYQRRG